MAESATLARPYAKAAFMAARDAKALADWSQALRNGVQLACDPQAADLFTNPKLDADDIGSMFEGFGGEGIEEHWRNFVKLLAQNKRLEVLPDIARQFEELRAAYENELEVEVTSAVEMSPAQRDKFVASLKTRFKRDVRMTTRVDASLLGGAVVRAGDLVIDGSIQGRLQRMAAEL